jgi:hypothetical protein
MKKWIWISCISAITSLMFMAGCDNDSGTEWNGTLIGKWGAAKEIVTVPDAGKLTLVPQSDFFMNLLIEVNEDSTFEYEKWTGPDKTAEDAEYDTGVGIWSVNGSAFSFQFSDSAATVYEGTYKASKKTLIINITMVVEMFSTDPLPIEVTFNRLEE